MRGFAEEAPEPGGVAAWDGGCDVLGCVAEVDGVDLGLAVCAQQAGA